MSLDVYLDMPGAIREERPRIFVRENGATREISREEWDARYPGTEPVTCCTGGDERVYSRNITHNLGRMAEAAGIYKELWHPGDIGISTAAQLIEPLRAGLVRLRTDPGRFFAFNPSNGWGTYEGLVEFVTDYLRACEKFPNAAVSVLI